MTRGLLLIIFEWTTVTFRSKTVKKKKSRIICTTSPQSLMCMRYVFYLRLFMRPIRICSAPASLMSSNVPKISERRRPLQQFCTFLETEINLFSFFSAHKSETIDAQGLVRQKRSVGHISKRFLPKTRHNRIEGWRVRIKKRSKQAAAIRQWGFLEEQSTCTRLWKRVLQ